MFCSILLSQLWISMLKISKNLTLDVGYNFIVYCSTSDMEVTINASIVVGKFSCWLLYMNICSPW